MSHDQLLDYAYKLRTEVETLQEKNSSLKRAMYGRKKENVNIDQLSLFNEAELEHYSHRQACGFFATNLEQNGFCIKQQAAH